MDENKKSDPSVDESLEHLGLALFFTSQACAPNHYIRIGMFFKKDEALLKGFGMEYLNLILQ